MMRPIHTREEYLSLRNGGEQQQLVRRIRNGEEKLKFQLVEMNYSCLPNERLEDDEYHGGHGYRPYPCRRDAGRSRAYPQ